MKRMIKGAALGTLLLAVASPAFAQDEKYQWLEAPLDEKALAWATEQTKAAQAKIAAFEDRDAIEAELRQLLAAGDPPPAYYPLGPVMLRFQRSVSNPHGTLAVAHKGKDGAYGTLRDVLDIDALRKSEGKPYEFHSFSFADSCLAPDYVRCLISLSPSGGDETEIREFDLEKARFVDDGFRVPLSRASAVWIDRDQLLLAHTAGTAARLPSGWGRTVSLWKRGTPLASARTVFEAAPTDALLMLSATRDADRSRTGVIRRFIDYSTIETSLVRADGTTEKTNLPTRIKMMLGGIGGGRILSQLAEPADVNGKTLPAETLVIYDTRRDIPPGKRLSILTTPTPGEFIADPFSGITIGQSSISMVIDRRGVKRIDTLRNRNGIWQLERGNTEPAGVSVSFGAADPESDAAVVTRSGYLVPTRQELAGGSAPAKALYSEKPVFDADKFVVDLKTARSKDGTEIDYYLLHPKTIRSPGATPTLMTGYGAFGISISPGYLDAFVGGRSLVPWLTRGGALALPLIRGGGDRGAAWHSAAIRENRQKSYDDFAAVTEALIAEGFTSPKHIGVFGQSNGGLLAATMGTQRPDLYGAIVSDVPLTDLIRMPLMGMGAAWTNEYGDPSDPKMAEIIKRYSPFQNIRSETKYPPFMVTVATSDNRVGPGHARKLAARLLDAGAEVYYLEDQEGGHGVSDPLSRPELMADRMTFLIDKLK